MSLAVRPARFSAAAIGGSAVAVGEGDVMW